MKQLKYIFAGFLILGSQAVFATGPITSGGGDWYAMEFVLTGRDLVTWLRGENHPALPSKLTAKSLEKTIDTTLVESSEKPLKLRGVLKDAINYPAAKRIVFSRKAWSLQEAAFDRNKLVLHEYLGIMGIPDDKYQISSHVGAIESPPLEASPVCSGAASTFAEGLGNANSMNVKKVKFLRLVTGNGDGYEYYNISLEDDTRRTCYIAKFSTETMCLLSSAEVDLQCLAAPVKPALSKF